MPSSKRMIVVNIERDARDAATSDDGSDAMQRDCSIPMDPVKKISWSLPEAVPERKTTALQKKPQQARHGRRLGRLRHLRSPQLSAMSTPTVCREFNPAVDLRLQDYSADLSRAILPGLDVVGRIKSFGVAELHMLTSASSLGDLGTASARMMLQGFAGFERHHQKTIYEALRGNVDVADSFPVPFRWFSHDQVSGNFIPLYVFEIPHEVADQIYGAFNAWMSAILQEDEDAKAMFLESSFGYVNDAFKMIDDPRIRPLVGTLARHFPFFRPEVRKFIVDHLKNKEFFVHLGYVDISAAPTDGTGGLVDADDQGGSRDGGAVVPNVAHTGSGVSSLGRSVTTSFMMENCNPILLFKELMQLVIDELVESGTFNGAQAIEPYSVVDSEFSSNDIN